MWWCVNYGTRLKVSNSGGSGMQGGQCSVCFEQSNHPSNRMMNGPSQSRSIRIVQVRYTNIRTVITSLLDRLSSANVWCRAEAVGWSRVDQVTSIGTRRSAVGTSDVDVPTVLKLRLSFWSI